MRRDFIIIKVDSFLFCITLRQYSIESIKQYVFLPFLKNEGISEMLSSGCRILLHAIEMRKLYGSNCQILMFKGWSSVLL